MAISPQLPEHSASLIRRHRLRFDILFDEGSEVIARYGLEYNLPDYLIEVYKNFGLNLDEFNGEPRWRLPIPARYIIDTDGSVRYARIHPDYTTRPEPSETVEALRALARG